MRQAQAYALTNGLGLQDGMPTVATGSTPAASVEASREAAQNRVNALEQQLASAKSVGNRTVFRLRNWRPMPAFSPIAVPGVRATA